MFELPDLPYDYDSLQPVISSDTLQLHHKKHHAKYVETVNKLLADSGRKPASLEEVVRDAAGDAQAKKLFNNAAQAWNHAFFWDAMSPDRQTPDGPLAQAIDKAFGGLKDLRKAFVTEGVNHFGSGWVWLAARGGALEVLSTHDGENLLTQDGLIPLLVCDLWEHAYYLDYQNDRQGFLEAWFDRLPNWRLAARQLEGATGGGRLWRYPAPTA
jgi:Fe-Mn family superoxide dismutase